MHLMQGWSREAQSSRACVKMRTCARGAILLLGVADAPVAVAGGAAVPVLVTLCACGCAGAGVPRAQAWGMRVLHASHHGARPGVDGRPVSHMLLPTCRLEHACHAWRCRRPTGQCCSQGPGRACLELLPVRLHSQLCARALRCPPSRALGPTHLAGPPQLELNAH